MAFFLSHSRLMTEIFPQNLLNAFINSLATIEAICFHLFTKLPVTRGPSVRPTTLPHSTPSGVAYDSALAVVDYRNLAVPFCPKPSVYGPGDVDDPCGVQHFCSLHPGGALWAFADGSVRFLKYSAAPILPALSTRSGGEIVEVPRD
jgi:hypothetical protein